MPRCVGRAERPADLQEDGDRPRERHGPVPVEDAGQALPVEGLHDEVGLPFRGVPEVEDLDDVLLADLARRPGLVLEAVEQLLVAGELRAQHLHGHALAERDVLGEVDAPHPALSQAGQDAVAVAEDPPHEVVGGREERAVDRADGHALVALGPACGANRHTRRAPRSDKLSQRCRKSGRKWGTGVGALRGERNLRGDGLLPPRRSDGSRTLGRVPGPDRRSLDLEHARHVREARDAALARRPREPQRDLGERAQGPRGRRSSPGYRLRFGKTEVELREGLTPRPLQPLLAETRHHRPLPGRHAGRVAGGPAARPAAEARHRPELAAHHPPRPGVAAADRHR